jgi:hypothetical protein
MSEKNTNAVIWMDDTHAVSGYNVVLEDDGKSCWLYLREHPRGKVLKSVIVYSPIPPVSRADFEKTVGCGDIPILMADYASVQATITERYPDDFSFVWRDDGVAAAVRYRDEVLAVISREERFGSSRAVSRSGPFGDPLELSRYPWLQKEGPTRR